MVYFIISVLYELFKVNKRDFTICCMMISQLAAGSLNYLSCIKEKEGGRGLNTFAAFHNSMQQLFPY